MPEALRAAFAHVRADPGLGVERAIPAAVLPDALDQPPVSLDDLEHRAPGVDLLRGLGILLLAVPARLRGRHARGTAGEARAAALLLLLAVRAGLVAAAVVHERGVRLVLGAVDVHVRPDALVVAAGSLDELRDRVEDRLLAAFELAKSHPYAAIRRLLIEAAQAPQVRCRLVMPRLDIDMARDDERDRGELPVTGLARARPVHLKIACLAQIVPEPLLAFQQLDDVLGAPHGGVAAEGGCLWQLVGRLEALAGHGRAYVIETERRVLLADQI